MRYRSIKVTETPPIKAANLVANSGNTAYGVGVIIDGILPEGPTRHAYAWQIGPFWQDTIDLWVPDPQMNYGDLNQRW